MQALDCAMIHQMDMLNNHVWRLKSVDRTYPSNGAGTAYLPHPDMVLLLAISYVGEDGDYE